MTDPSRPDGLVVLGRIDGLFGILGWVKVYSYTRPREKILTYTPWLVGTPDGWREIAVEQGRVQGKGIVAKFTGYDDRDQASRLIGIEVGCLSTQLPPVKKGEFYWAQLEGLKVVNLSGQELGVVSRLIETGANDVIVVRNGRERWIPATPGVLQDVDLAAGLIRVDWDADF